MSTLTTLRGKMTKDGIFFPSTGGEIRFAPVKNFNYDYGEVYALFEICANTYILWQTVPIASVQD